MERIDWIMSDGGPLVCLEKRLKYSWGGIERLSYDDGSGAENDYERACQVASLADTVPLMAGCALILGDMPLNTRFWQSKNGSIYIVRLRWAEPNIDIENLLSELHASKLVQTEQNVELVSETADFVLFDSVELGEDDYPLVEFPLPTGSLLLSTFSYDPDPDTSMYLHEIRRKNRI